MADRFYADAPLSPGEFVLTGPDAHHLAVVRRFAVGDRVTLFNGDGDEYPGEILSAGKKQVVLNLSPRVEANRELPSPVVVAAALPKGDRADYLIEKLTELGTTRFIPLVTSRAVIQPKEAKMEKLLRGVIEASKQCGRNVLMGIDPPCGWTAFVSRADLPATKFILHTSGDDRTSAATVDRSWLAQGVAFAVGPEGGFSPEEVDQAQAAGWQAVSFGPRVLRMETAAVVAVAWAITG
jgi:16S rRNA (uracil1498-N3)-methyltransferase